MITAIELPEGENDPRLMARAKAANGKTMLIFDPTDEVTPVGLIAPHCKALTQHLQRARQPGAQMPVLTPQSAGLTRTGAFTLTEDGAISGDINEVFTGDDATSERWFIKDTIPRSCTTAWSRA